MRRIKLPDIPEEHRSRPPILNYDPSLLRDEFSACYGVHTKYDGQPFELLACQWILLPARERGDFVYLIRFADGYVLVAWGEEVCVTTAERDIR